MAAPGPPRSAGLQRCAIVSVRGLLDLSSKDSNTFPEHGQEGRGRRGEREDWQLMRTQREDRRDWFGGGGQRTWEWNEAGWEHPQPVSLVRQLLAFQSVSFLCDSNR